MNIDYNTWGRSDDLTDVMTDVFIAQLGLLVGNVDVDDGFVTTCLPTARSLLFSVV